MQGRAFVYFGGRKKADLLSGAAAFAAVLLCVWRVPAVLYLAVVGLACGLAFVRVTPALTAPDEYTHEVLTVRTEKTGEA